MLDFTSALYLGMRHPSPSLRPWPALTTGKPAALAPPPHVDAVAGDIATLLGCERATLVPSTLHLFWDLFGLVAAERVRIYMDAGTYAIARWGVERAAARGVPVRRFPHHDAAAARSLIAADRAGGYRPVIVADGFCPGCGAPAPMARYLDCVERDHGTLILDDTQALGVLGEGASAVHRYGRGGGGSLRWQGVDSSRVIVGASLAKGFGVPVAALAGDDITIRRFEQHSETRVHASPPSAAVIHAAERALAVNRTQGERLRLHLWRLVRRFRDGLRRLGLAARGGMFPVQTLEPIGVDATTLHARLLGLGIRTVVVRGCGGIGARLTFLITALHRTSDIDRAIEGLERAMRSDRAAMSLGGPHEHAV